ncbi:hypothetical protein BDV95DRAFT_47404 [Massariosphaeria phaeospora]|uniref:Uncharacterized protein n=1 Tax=Massariosphaeria phaeospora TaxID=100035 RepID=A0A7C8M8J7_9PLEO|nr:hypothetical protein BDV95DRAFT_47404 [Massariosphaeria phaeospora]
MSTSGGPPLETKDVERRSSLSKYVKRMSSVFKKPAKTSSSESAAPSSPTLKAGEEASTPAAAAPASAPAPPTTKTQELNRHAMQQERARALFAKYGLTLESHEWISTAPPQQPISVQRVEKPIRMRVHRTCHHCGTTFGGDKTCSKCEHSRCKKCPRYPKKRTPGEKAKEAAVLPQPRKKKLLTIPSKTGGELAYQQARQRVRRTCHKCEALFVPATATVCEGCRHIRCTKCPREPAKLNKWPNGYPGDVDADSDAGADAELEKAKRIWKRPRTRVRWECEECHSLFMEGSPQCPGCGHERCEKCTRNPLKRVKKEQEFDPDVVRAVEAKLRALAMGADPVPLSAGGT